MCGSFPAANQSICPAFGMMVHSAITASGLGGVRSGLPTPSGLPATTDLAVTLSLAMSTENLYRERDSNPRPRAFNSNIPSRCKALPTELPRHICSPEGGETHGLLGFRLPYSTGSYPDAYLGLSRRQVLYPESPCPPYPIFPLMRELAMCLSVAPLGSRTPGAGHP